MFELVDLAIYSCFCEVLERRRGLASTECRVFVEPTSTPLEVGGELGALGVWTHEVWPGVEPRLYVFLDRKSVV